MRDYYTKNKTAVVDGRIERSKVDSKRGKHAKAATARRRYERQTKHAVQGRGGK